MRAKTKNPKRGVKKYLTELLEGQIQWIKRAAKDIDVNEPNIVQIAIGRLMSQEWVRVKEEWARNRAKERLEAIEREKARLKQEEEALKNLTVMAKREPAVN